MLDVSEKFAFTRNGVTIEFFKADPVDTKFSFRIVGDEERTQKLRSLCKRKMHKKGSIMYAIDGLFEKILKGLDASSVRPLKNEYEKTSLFVQAYQRSFGRSPRFEETTEGVPNTDFFGVKVIAPSGETFFGVGKSKKAARLNLAQKNLQSLQMPA